MHDQLIYCCIAFVFLFSRAFDLAVVICRVSHPAQSAVVAAVLKTQLDRVQGLPALLLWVLVPTSASLSRIP